MNSNLDPPQPQPSTSDTNETMLDITSLLFSASTNELTYKNPLVHNSNFDLYESMSALDLMDPIMDPCEIPSSYYTSSVPTDNKNKNKSSPTVPPRQLPLHITDKNDKDNLPWTTLTIEQSTVISLELISRFYSFLDGSSLPESIFTCLYVHTHLLQQMRLKLLFDININDITNEKDSGKEEEHTVLPPPVATTTTTTTPAELEEENRTQIKKQMDKRIPQWSIYSIAALIVQNTKLIRQIVKHADIHEEEDFNTSSYNIFDPPQQQQDGDEKGNISVNSTSATTTTTTANNHSNTTTALIDEKDQDIQDRNYISIFIEHLQTIIDAADDDNKNKNKDMDIILKTLIFLMDLFNVCHVLSSGLRRSNVISNLNLVQESVRNGMENINHLIKILEDQQQQKTEKEDSKYQLLLHQTFDSYMNRPSLGNSPVRNIQFKSSLESIQFLAIIFQQLDTAVCKLLLRGTSLSKIYRILHNIASPSSASSSSSLTAINILSRSLIVINLYFDELIFGQQSIPHLIIKHIHQYGIPQSITSSPYCLQFITRLSKPIYDTIKVLALNKNRQHTYIKDVIFHEWNRVLIQGATIVDHHYRQEYNSKNAGANTNATTTTANDKNVLLPFMTNYTLDIVVGWMEYYLSLGIELQLYTNQFDLWTVYWYWDFLLSTRINVITGMKSSLIEHRRKNVNATTENCNNGSFSGSNGGSVTTGGVSGGKIDNGGGGKSHKKKGRKGKKQQTTISNQKAKNNGGGNSKMNTGALEHNDMNNPLTTAEDLEDHVYLLVLTMERSMCRGIVRSIAILHQKGIISKPTYEFTTVEKIFEKRFEPFQQYQHPQPLTYNDFQQGTDFSSVSSKDLIELAFDCFKSCRKVLDEILSKINLVDSDFCAISKEETMSAIKVCVTNSLFLLKISKYDGIGEEGTVPTITFDFHTHKKLCSINMK